MNTVRCTAFLATLLFLGVAPVLSRAADADGVAVAIVYDTSGSMKDAVRDDKGRPAAKYVIANRALEAIARRLQAFAANTNGGSSRVVQAGLFVFSDRGARPAIPFGPFNAPAFESWARRFDHPQGGTPLGTAIRDAGRAVLASNLTRKHVLVLTDGESNIGPDPASTMSDLKRQAEQKQTGLSLHFVAFDVDAKVFDAVKKLGATVVGAANETQLNTQLEFILEKKILLEDEEPPTKK
jgi:hypothetical protein